MSTPAWQPPQPVTGSDRRKGCLVGAGVAVGGLLIFAAIGAIIGPQKTAATASTTSSPTAVTISPTTALSPSATPSPTPSKTQAATPSASAPAVIPSSGPTYLAPASARHQAAAILQGSDAYYQQVFNAGVPVILDRGQPNSFPAFAAWQQAHGQGDVQEGMTAFKKADAFFNADDEPSTITDWQADNGQLSSDVAQLDSDGDGVGGPDDATYRGKVQADVKQFQKDYATAEQDAANVEAGK